MPKLHEQKHAEIGEREFRRSQCIAHDDEAGENRQSEHGRLEQQIARAAAENREQLTDRVRDER